MDPRDIYIGKRVFWNDPDNGVASGRGRVVALQNEPVDDETLITIDFDDDGGADVYAHELEEA